MKKKTRCFVPLLLVFAILCSLSVFSGPSATEKSGEYHDAGSGYERRIFGDYRFVRGEKDDQKIYSGFESAIDKSGNGIPSFEERTVYAAGIIEKYMHDGKRYIAYHITPTQKTDPGIDAPCYAILDTQTEEIGLFRKSFLEYLPVVYDQYILWDTQEDAVREFDSRGQLNDWCSAQNIALTIRVAR